MILSEDALEYNSLDETANNLKFFFSIKISVVFCSDGGDDITILAHCMAGAI